MEEKLSFRRALNRIGHELSRQDLENLKFMCKDVIPESRLEKCRTSLDLFVALEERGHLGKDNLDFLTNCIATIDRYPILSHLKTAGFSVPDPVINGSSPQHSPGEHKTRTTPDEFRKLLMQISQQLHSHEVDRLAFSWCEPYLGTSRDSIYSCTQLFTLMQQRNVITPTNLDCLYAELNENGRFDLMQLIEDYLLRTGQVKSSGHYSIGGISINPPSYERIQSDPISGLHQRPDNISIPSTPSSSSSSFISSSYPTPVSEEVPQEVRYPPSFQHSHPTVLSGPASYCVPPQRPPGLEGQQHFSHPLTDNPANKSQPHGSVKEDSPPAQIGCRQPYFNPSPVLTFQPDEPPPSEGLPYTKLVQIKNSELAQKEGEIRQLMGQLNHATTIQDRQNEENTEMIRMHKLAIVQLQDDLKLKNSELNKLRQEMRDLYTAITSGGKGEEYYTMPNTPHGICLIINNHMFHQVDPRYEALSDRGGAPVDQRNLVLTFEFLHYKVEVHENCTSVEMVDLMKEMNSRDHSQYDSFVCCILSHGEEGKVFGADSRPVDLRDITALIKGTFCRTLIDKPKLFFVQACRGEAEDPGIKVLSDGNSSLPVEADFLFGYATPPGNAAYRSRRHGSWFISELCQVFSQDSQVLGLGSMMKKVNRKVSDAYTKEGHKQCTEVVDRLRKEVHFFRDFAPRR